MFATWIDVTKEQPKRGRDVLVCGKDGICVARKRGIKNKYSFSKNCVAMRWPVSVQYWMELPKIPQDVLIESYED